MSAFHTPLRYPGGKGRLGPWLAYTMRYNGIGGGTYVEPYAGGAGAALYLLRNEYVNKIILNDIDPLIYSFWASALYDNAELIDLIRSTPITIETWHSQRKILNSDYASRVERGFAAFFLNRTNRSGILLGGVVGGLHQKNKYSLDARLNKADLIRRIEIIGSMASRINIYNLDALEFLNITQERLSKRSLIYLDPPYYQKGQQLYRNFYNAEDHAKVAHAIQRIRTPWLVTYDNAQEITNLYNKCKRCTFALHYSSTAKRSIATEQMFWRGLSLPMAPTLSRKPTGYPKAWETMTSPSASQATL